MGEGMIPTESRLRETRTAGSTSRGWNRTYGRRTMHRRESVRRTPRTLRAPSQPPDSTGILATSSPLFRRVRPYAKPKPSKPKR